MGNVCHIYFLNRASVKEVVNLKKKNYFFRMATGHFQLQWESDLERIHKQSLILTVGQLNRWGVLTTVSQQLNSCFCDNTPNVFYDVNLEKGKNIVPLKDLFTKK